MLRRKGIFTISLSLAVASSLMMTGNNVFAKTLNTERSSSFAAAALNR